MALQDELTWFETHRAQLLKQYFGKFVIVRDQTIRGSFDSAQAAYEAGVKAYGRDGFLLKQVLPEDPVQTMPAIWMGKSASI